MIHSHLTTPRYLLQIISNGEWKTVAYEDTFDEVQYRTPKVPNIRVFDTWAVRVMDNLLDDFRAPPFRTKRSPNPFPSHRRTLKRQNLAALSGDR